MNALRRQLHCQRWLASWMIALALAVRLLVPAGYMPMAGKLGLEICAGQTVGTEVMASMPGMKAAQHSMPHAGHGTPTPADHAYDCGFAAAVGGAADLPALILPAMPAPVALPVFLVGQLTARPGLGLAAPPPPQTGPPAFLR